MTAKEIESRMQDSVFLNAYGANWVEVKYATKWITDRSGISTLAEGCEPDWRWDAMFRRWRAIVTLKNGYQGFAYPIIPHVLDDECSKNNAHLKLEDNGYYYPEIACVKTENILLWWVVWEEWKDEECRSTHITRELVAAASAERAVQIVLDHAEMEWPPGDRFECPKAFRFYLPTNEGIITEEETETSQIKLTYGGDLNERAR